MAQSPAFETASIKPVAAGEKCESSMIQPMTGGGLRIECLPLKAILTWVYDIRDFQLSGVPSWAEGLSWNIIAKPEHTAPDAVEYQKMGETQRKRFMEEVRERADALLKDRFHLVYHREAKDQPVYVLTIAKTGSKLKDPAANAPGFIRRGRSEIISRGGQFSMLAQYLAIDLGRPVVDRTGLSGNYEFELKWTNDASGPSLFTAIQEQLGLRLSAERAPVETLVIDRIEKPSDN